MRLRHLLTILLACTALAGCTVGDGDGTTTTTPTQDYEIEASNVPETAQAGVPFSYHLDIQGPPQNTPHIGGHFWNSTVPTPDPTSAEHTALRKSCEHQAGDVPGDFTIMCTIEEEGEHILYGHAQVTVGDVTRNLWDGPFTITVAAA
jgi:hypothetical protein